MAYKVLNSVDKLKHAIDLKFYLVADDYQYKKMLNTFIRTFKVGAIRMYPINELDEGKEDERLDSHNC